jgi:ribose transport system substrate-binding protein
MTMRRSLVSLGSAVFCISLSACSGDGEEAVDAVKLAMVPKTSNNLVFVMGNEGAQIAARDLTASSGSKVEVEYIASVELDSDMEQANIREAIDKGVDGLLVSCLDESINAPIDEAVAAGIPVITFDSDCPDTDRLGFYSMASEETGAKGADLLAAALGSGAKKVAILNGRAGADNLDRRERGFRDQMAAEYPDVEIVMTGNCLETGDSCGEVLEEEIISAHPDLDGLFVVGLWGVLNACTCDSSAMNCSCEDTQLPKWKEAGRSGLKTVSYDTLPFELELMKQGYISALIGQKYFGWGYDTTTMMFDHLKSGRVIEGFIDSGFDVVCPNNVDDMASKWQAKDFRRPLAPACNL